MAIATAVEVIESPQWPQHDIRDPLGVWGARVGVTGNATGSGIKVAFDVAAAKRSAYVYTCYSAQAVLLTGTVPSTKLLKIRLLTNWPNVDPIPNVQAYGSAKIVTWGASSTFSAPIALPLEPLITEPDRFLLLFDPRQQVTLGTMTIVELELGDNVDTDTYSFEAYGYFWDRSVMTAPAGPRHPGSG